MRAYLAALLAPEVADDPPRPAAERAELCDAKRGGGGTVSRLEVGRGWDLGAGPGQGLGARSRVPVDRG